MVLIILTTALEDVRSIEQSEGQNSLDCRSSVIVSNDGSILSEEEASALL